MDAVRDEIPGLLSEEVRENTSDFRQEVDEIREIVHGIVHDTPFSEKVHTLYDIIEEISDELRCRRNIQSGSRIQSIEVLRQNIDELHQEWNSVATTLHAQRERLEALLDSFPGAIETSTVRALSLRVSHLEQLVAQLVEESRARSSARGSRTQLYVSLAALGTTVVLWGLWIGIGLLG